MTPGTQTLHRQTEREREASVWCLVDWVKALKFLPISTVFLLEVSYMTDHDQHKTETQAQERHCVLILPTLKTTNPASIAHAEPHEWFIIGCVKHRVSPLHY